MDDFYTSGANIAVAYGVTISKKGLIYVSGAMQGQPDPTLAAGHYWITRAANLGSNPPHFENSDVLLYPPGVCSGFLAGPAHSGSAVDSRGNPLIGGAYTSASAPGSCNWTIRKFSK